MAELKITVGNFTAAATASDTNAIEVLQNALRGGGYNIDGMSGNEQAQAIISLMVSHIEDLAEIQKSKEQVEAAKATIEALKTALEEAKAALPVSGAVDNPPEWGG